MSIRNRSTASKRRLRANRSTTAGPTSFKAHADTQVVSHPLPDLGEGGPFYWVRCLNCPNRNHLAALVLRKRSPGLNRLILDAWQEITVDDGGLVDKKLVAFADIHEDVLEGEVTLLDRPGGNIGGAANREGAKLRSPHRLRGFR